MPPVTQSQARDLARKYLELSHTLGQYRFDHWDDLAPEQRKEMEDREWSLQNLSSDMTTMAVGIDLDDLAGDLKVLQDASDKARAALTDLHAAGSLLVVAAKMVTLGGAIISRDPSAIASAAGGLVEAVKATVS
jgi:hypothetical protein